MAAAFELETPRLRLRQWRDSHREPFATLNADPIVMECFAARLSRQASDPSIAAWQSRFAERGWTTWAQEGRACGRFVGCVGLTIPVRVLPFSPFVEIGWRPTRAQWPQGRA